MELINAKWDLANGRTVDFRIAGNGFDRMHPFKKFQRARGGRLGTIFAAAIADAQGQLRANTEVMLKGWTETATGGQQFSLWLDDEATQHPFAGCRHRRNQDEPGEMFFVSLIPMPEDVNEEPREGKVKTIHVSNEAHKLVCRTPMFLRFLEETRRGMKSEWTVESAKEYVKSILGIESLSYLDKIPGKAQEYRDRVVMPYERWKGGH